MSKTKKTKEITLVEAKEICKIKGLEPHTDYDKRYKNTWLYTIGQDVEPVLRSTITHVPKPKRKKLTWNDLTLAASTAPSIDVVPSVNTTVEKVSEMVDSIPQGTNDDTNITNMSDEEKLEEMSRLLESFK